RVGGDLEVHDPQRLARDLRQRVRLGDEPGKDPGATLSRLVEQQPPASVSVGERLHEQLAFLQLVDRLEAANERVLEGGQCRRLDRRRGEQVQRVLLVLHEGDYSLRGRAVRVRLRLVFFFLCP